MPKNDSEKASKNSSQHDEEMKDANNEDQIDSKTGDDRNLKFNMISKHRSSGTNAPNLLRRFKINLRLISQSHKNKISTRFQEIDRLYVCRKTKEQRDKMGVEFEDIKLTDVYIKSNPHKIAQKYG